VCLAHPCLLETSSDSTCAHEQVSQVLAIGQSHLIVEADIYIICKSHLTVEANSRAMLVVIPVLLLIMRCLDGYVLSSSTRSGKLVKAGKRGRGSSRSVGTANTEV
jgi:hypothetical protein